MNAQAAHYTIDELIDIDRAQAAWSVLEELQSIALDCNARVLQREDPAQGEAREELDTFPDGLIDLDQARATQRKARDGVWLASEVRASEHEQGENLVAALPDLLAAIEDLHGRLLVNADLQARLTGLDDLRAREQAAIDDLDGRMLPDETIQAMSADDERRVSYRALEALWAQMAADNDLKDRLATIDEQRGWLGLGAR